jgi:hypothetical protein
MQQMLCSVLLAAALVAGSPQTAAGQCAAPNQAPRVTIRHLAVDTVREQVVLEYDLHDPEADSMQVSLDLMSLKGDAWTPVEEGSSGDVGFPVLAGRGKRIVWQYTDQVFNVFNYKLRVTADDRYRPSISEMLSLVDSNAIRRNLQAISGLRHRKQSRGLAHLLATRKLLLDSLKAYTRAAHQQTFDYQGYRAANVVGTLTSPAASPGTYVLGAHYDAVEGSPGADDNASGVAGLLEAARILSQYSFKFNINFVCFDLEEEGAVGSQHYLDDGIPAWERVQGAVNLDMIGYYSKQPASQPFPDELRQDYPEAYRQVAAGGFRANFLLSTANETSAALNAAFTRQAAAYLPELKVLPLVVADDGVKYPHAFRASDHFRFWDKGLPAIYLGDTGNVRNHNYHSAKDQLGTVNVSFVTRVTKATVAAFAHLAQVQHCGVDSRAIDPGQGKQ